MNPLQKLAASALCAIFVLMVLATLSACRPPMPGSSETFPTPILRPHILFGTDALGRDSLSRLLYGTRVFPAPRAGCRSSFDHDCGFVRKHCGSPGRLGRTHCPRLRLISLSLCRGSFFFFLSCEPRLPLDVSAARVRGHRLLDDGSAGLAGSDPRHLRCRARRPRLRFLAAGAFFLSGC